MRFLIACCFLFLMSVQSWASHIVGGNIVLTARGNTANESTLLLNLIYDQLAVGTVQNNVVVSIFSKSDNRRIADFTLQREPTQLLPFFNAACVSTVTSQLALVRYTAFVVLSPDVYNDPAGYYVAWEQCCRNSAVINLQNGNNTGLVFYLEIPPTSLKNNSPGFKNPEVKYVCRGLLFDLDFGAVDLDNDELRYSFATPLAGFTNQGNAIPALPRSGNYPRVRWGAGFDSTRAIPSSSPVVINAQTGIISLTPSRLGVYVFSVLCEEYRRGAKIGETRRDYEITVVDCPKAPPPAVLVVVKKAPATATFEQQPNRNVDEVALCRGDSVTLKANDENPRWAYQWQLDGKEIAGQNQVSATFGQAGNYTVVKSFAKACGTEGTIEASTRVSFKNAAAVKIVSSQKMPLCGNDSTNLTLKAASTLTNTVWQRDKITLSNVGNSLPSIRQEGLYKVTTTDATGCVSRDSLLVRIVEPPEAKITLVGKAIFCEGDSTKLLANRRGNYDYLWFADAIPVVKALGAECRPEKSGEYSVQVTDTTTKCVARSSTVAITVKPTPRVTLDSIPPLCGVGAQAVLLRGNPDGGVYSGRGVVGTRFVSINLTAGIYPVVYTVTNLVGCSNRATRNVVLSPAPRLQIPRQLTVLKGESVEIKTTLPSNSTVQWSPAIGLDNPRAERPVATPDRTTTYRVRIRTGEGCEIDQTVEIVVIDVKIPNGFTPNADGANDTWELAGIAQYPNCVVEIVNRWGTVVFKSQGYQTEWDGSYNGQALPVGTYYYVVNLREVDYKLAGSVSVIR